MKKFLVSRRRLRRLFAPSPEFRALLKPDNGTVVARGEAVYARNCASCHGEYLEGQAD